MKKIFKKIITPVLIIITLNGCSGVNLSSWHFPYMMEVQQGNYITDAQYNQLKVGMSKDEVVFIMDRPLTQFMFDQNRWDYIYQDYQNDKLLKSYTVSILFNKQGIVTNISKAGTLESK